MHGRPSPARAARAHRRRALRRTIPCAAALLAAATLSPARAGAAAGSLRDRLVGMEIAAAHPPLDDPPTRSLAEAGHMRSDDVVVGLALPGAARAYPWWVLKNAHTVNDRLDGMPVVIAFCEQCSGAAAFRREVDGRVLAMRTAGVWSGTVVLEDRQTGTLWAPFDGHALEGPLAPRRLERLPVQLATWAEWSARHPGTDVVFADPRHRGGHGAREAPGKWGVVAEMGGTLSRWDGRLPENTMVFGVREGTVERAYPRAAVVDQGGAVHDEVGGRTIVVLAAGEYGIGGYDRRLAGRTLTFEANPHAPGRFRDRETGSAWTVEGAAVEGPLAGRRLEPIEGFAVEWHVWSDYHPGTTLFEPPEPAEAGGFRFPLTALERLDGETARLHTLPLDAEVNLVVLWATWCPPCREKLPLLRKLAAEAAETGAYRFVSIAVQIPDPSELAALKAFLHAEQIDWPVYLFDDHQYRRLDEAYREHGGAGLVVPMAFLIDGDGMVTRVLAGGEIDGLEQALAEAMRVQISRRRPISR